MSRTDTTTGRWHRGGTAMAVTLAIPIAIALGGVVEAQRGNAAQPPASARAAAIVNEDWRWRMVTPPKGDYRGIPLTDEGRKVADAWDPARDEATGEQCRSYGAPALMGVPGRVRFSWQDDETLKVETDAGTQTRLHRFRSLQAAAGAARSWQGHSAAQWQVPRPNVPLNLRPADRTPGVPPPAIGKGGSLKVVTTNLRAGYLRKNGVPYSENAVLTEYWEVFRRDNGEQWLTITTIVEDLRYLRQPRLVAIPFKKEADGAKWDPTPCSAL
jgi:hypothetical protein